MKQIKEQFREEHEKNNSLKVKIETIEKETSFLRSVMESQKEDKENDHAIIEALRSQIAKNERNRSSFESLMKSDLAKNIKMYQESESDRNRLMLELFACKEQLVVGEAVNKKSI